MLDFRYRQAERQQARIFDFQPIIESCNSDGSSALGIIRMHNRVDDGFAQSDWRKRPNVRSFHFSNYCRARHMFLNEREDIIDCTRKPGSNLSRIEDLSSIRTCEPARLNPCIREVLEPIDAK